MEEAESKWMKAMKRLMERRKQKSIKRNLTTANYDSHFKKVRIGSSVLDVGCGSMDARPALMRLPNPPVYVGLDAFPINKDVVMGKIEEVAYPCKGFDTLIAFAVMDGVENLHAALVNMNRIAALNIVILTGLDIPVDDCHTFKITEDELVSGLKDFTIHFKEELCPRVWLYDFWRKS